MVEPLAIVDSCVAARLGALVLAANEQAEPLLLRLDPQRRAKVLMALVGLVLVGGMLVAIAYLGGRHLRRLARNKPTPTASPEDLWYRKPLVRKPGDSE